MAAPAAVLRHGGAAHVLHTLMEESVDGMLDDVAVHEALLDTLAAAAAAPALAPVLCGPSDFPAWLAPPAAAAAASASAGESVAARLARMATTCVLWQKAGAELLDSAGRDEAAEARALGLVLRVSDVADRVAAAAALAPAPAAAPPVRSAPARCSTYIGARVCRCLAVANRCRCCGTVE